MNRIEAAQKLRALAAQVSGLGVRPTAARPYMAATLMATDLHALRLGVAALIETVPLKPGEALGVCHYCPTVMVMPRLPQRNYWRCTCSPQQEQPFTRTGPA